MSLAPYGAATTESSVTRSANSLPYPNPHVAMESGAACAAAPGDLAHSGLHPGSEPATLQLTNGPPGKFSPADGSTVAVPDAVDLEFDLNEMLTRDGFGSPNPPNAKPKSRQRSTSRSPYLESQNEDRPKSRERRKDRTRRPSKSRYHDSAQVPKIDPDLFVNSMLKQQQETEIEKAKSRSLLERNKE